MRGMQPDLVHEPLHLCQVLICGGLCRVKVDLVSGSEMFFEQPAVFRYFIKDKQRFAAGYTGPEGTHLPGHFDDLGRDVHRVLVCKDRVRPLPLA